MTVRRWMAAAVTAACLVLAVGCASSSGESSDSAAAPAASSSGSDSYADNSYDAGDAISGNENVAASSEDASVDSATAGAATESGQAPAVEQAPAAPEQADPVAGAPAAVGRTVVSTSMVTIESDNVIEARQRTAAIVTQAGGAIYDEETEIGETGRTTLTLKVPPAQFQAVLDQLGQVGKLTSQGISTEDVTEQVIDLDARIATAEASVARYKAFLDEETSRTEIASLEQELTNRETQLETLRGQKRTLDARVDLATIVLTVKPPPVVAVAPVEPSVEAKPSPNFVDGVQDGWSALVSVLTVVGGLVGWVLPFVPFFIAAVLGFRWYRRRHPIAASSPSSLNMPPPPQPVA